MHSFMTLILAIVALIGFTSIVNAECYDTVYGGCDAKTASTPCCGDGKCNIFCCNCDNGIRTDTYDYCIGEADRRYGPESDCSVCLVDSVHSKTCRQPGECQRKYDAAIATCKAKYGGSQPKMARYLARRYRQAGSAAPVDPADGYEVFAFVDKDRSGNITLDEYVDYLHSKLPGLQGKPDLLLDWVKYFETFDQNGDGVIHIDEHHRVVDDVLRHN